MVDRVLALNALLLIAVVMLGQRKPTGTTSRQQVTLWRHGVPDPLAPGAPILATQAAIAPDGSSIVFSDSVGGVQLLLRKDRDAAVAIPLAGTEGGVSPFFSPDGRWIGYLTMDGRLRKVPVEGGGSITLSEGVAPEYKVGTWLDDGTIVFADLQGGLTKTSSDGGAAVRLPVPGRMGQPITLSSLPGSRGFIISACAGNCSVSANIHVYDFKVDSVWLLVSGAAGAWYSPTGHLLYTVRDGGLYASRFDARSLQLQPGAVPVLEGVQSTRFAISAAGTILYSTDASTQAPSELLWVTKDGRTEAVDSMWRAFFEYPAISPDGSALAVSLRERTTDLWIRRSDGTRQKIIAGGVSNWRPSWMPDGRSVAFTSVRDPEDPHGVAAYVARADGSARAELLFDHAFGVWEAEMSRDGQWLVVRMDEENFNSNVYAQRLGGDTTLIPLLTDSTAETSVALSPDSRWLAYASNEAGQGYEVYVISFPDRSSKAMVSSGGGIEPRWSRDGRELFFVSGTRLMSVQVPPGESFNPGNPRALFSVVGYRRARNRPQYDVGPDGRFVMIKEGSGSASTGAVYVENWFTELLTKVRR